jgi:hypothetical protein
MDRNPFENGIMGDRKGNNADKAGWKSRLLRGFLEGFESALPFMIVWVLILFLMASGAAFRHSGMWNQHSQSSKSVTVFQSHKT